MNYIKRFLPNNIKLEDYEKQNKLWFVQGEVTEEGTHAEFIDVSMGFFVKVWNCQATLCLIGETINDSTYITESDFSYDDDLYEKLCNNVIYDDNKGAINISGQYFPQSKTSANMFEKLKDTMKKLT